MDSTLEIINGLLDTAGKSGGAVGEIARGFGAVKNLFQSSEPAADTDVKRALANLASQIADAELANADLKLQLATLKVALAERGNFEAELERYELWEAPAGAIVYRQKQAGDETKPLHYLCPNCVQEKRKSILQGPSHYRECSICKSGFSFEKLGMPASPKIGPIL